MREPMPSSGERRRRVWSTHGIDEDTWRNSSDVDSSFHSVSIFSLQQDAQNAQSSRKTGFSGWLDHQFVPDLVSVVVPTYNRCLLLGEAIESLAAQTWSPLQVIVVDDGSTDGTTEKWQSKLAAMSNERCTYQLITQVNSGVSVARNTGTLAARGEFIMYLDSDDRLYPEAITRYVEALRRHKATYCIAPIDTINECGRLAEEHQLFHPQHETEDYLFDCFWLAHSACYRREVINRAGCWNSQLRKGEDHEYLWRVKLTSGRAYYLDVVQGIYRLHSLEQIHHAAPVDCYRIRLRSIELFVEWLVAHGLLDRELRIRTARQCRILVTRLMLGGDIEGKNQAIQMINYLLAGNWHPLRLVTLLKPVNSVSFYARVSNWRYQWGKRRSWLATRRQTAALHKKDGCS